jgi:hypothetical protein
MNDILVALVAIVVIANLFYTVWSYRSLRRLLANVTTARSADRFLLDNIVHTRSSLNVLYASIAIMVFVLGYFGFNIQKNVTAEVRKDISEAASVDLDSLKLKAKSVSLLQTLASQNLADISKTKEQARVFFDALRQTPQRLFVVQAIPISKQKNRYLWSELKPVDGVRFPNFKIPPVVVWWAYDKEGTTLAFGPGALGGLSSTTQGIEVATVENPFSADLWVYVK